MGMRRSPAQAVALPSPSADNDDGMQQSEHAAFEIVRLNTEMFIGGKSCDD